MAQQFFFSIVIPAHNEEKYLKDTLDGINGFNYPKDKFEAIVVENGSTDKTLEIAQNNKGEKISVYSSSAKGVSLARNFGMEKISSLSDWTVFLDADTILKENFLNELNKFLQDNTNEYYTIGTTSVEPYPISRVARFWFSFWNLCHKIFKVSYSIQIAKSSLLKDIKYDELLEMGEDLKFIKDARKYGNFFFFDTRSVYSSTRRFEQIGWVTIFFQWTIVANLPFFFQKKSKYKVVR